MPELPEIRAHAERLTALVGGRILERFEPISFTALKNVGDPGRAVGTPLVGVTNRGKYLVLRFEPISFAVHLMQGGRLRPDPKAAARPKGAHARWWFAGGDQLLLTEAGTEKKAGVWLMDDPDADAEPLSGLGIEADAVTPATLAPLLGATNGRLHGFLRDQHNLAGLGRRLANEVCWRAKLSPFATTSKLGPEEIDSLVAGIRDAIVDDLNVERARDDMSSSKERPGGVHRRKGEPCPRCGGAIREVSYRAYQVNYCATCQTAGKVLADNTTSRFLK